MKDKFIQTKKTQNPINSKTNNKFIKKLKWVMKWIKEKKTNTYHHKHLLFN